MPRPTKRESQLTSNSSTEPERPRIGRLGRPHGLDGFLGLYVDAGDLVHFEVGATVYVQGRPYTVRSLRRGDKGPQVAFEEVTDRGAADAIRGSDVTVAERRRLDEGEYWPADLIGLRVVTVEGVELGRVVDVVPGVAQDRLVVGPEAIEIPLVSALVPSIDLEAGLVEVVTLPGLTAPPHSP